ncbi:MAG: DUF4838 domain-containing protein [Candidatus Pacebacteria bacterium]|nr:DUF4838 domain-containing protein [Candidatus Paceibacterota bacterium]
MSLKLLWREAALGAMVGAALLTGLAPLCAEELMDRLVDPDIRGSLSETHPSPGGFQTSPTLRWGRHDSPHDNSEYRGFLQYTIPDIPEGSWLYAAELVLSEVVNERHVGPPGVDVRLIDGEWDADTIYFDYPTMGPRKTSLSENTHRIDVTEWFDGTAEGLHVEPGDLFSLQIRRARTGGYRRARTNGKVQLKMTYVSDPEVLLILPQKPLKALDGGGRPAFTQREAAKRLQTLIRRATGLHAPITALPATVPDEVVRMYVGYGPHLSGLVSPPSRPEGLKIVEKEGNLFLLGEIAEAGTNNWPEPVDRGVMHAVETFAEEVLGYRFFFATLGSDSDLSELGTVTPDIGELTIKPGLLIEDAPAFKHRVPHGMPRGSIGLRTGSSVAFNCNHVHNPAAWRRMYGDEHPELFVLKEDGTRDWNHLDYAEPLVLEKEIEHLEAYFASDGAKRPGMARTPTSRYIMAEPTDNYPDSHSEAAKKLLKPDAGWGRQSNLWFDYVRRLAAEVEKRWPHMRVSTLAYQWHYYPPDVEIPDNVDVMVCLMRSSTQNKQPQVFQHNLKTVKEWLKRVGNDPERLFLWEYWCWPGFFVTSPTIGPYAMQRWLQTVQPYVSGVFINGGGHPRPFEYLMYRVWMRLQWDPQLDVTADIADACQAFYGPAGDTMTAFHRRLIQCYEKEWGNPLLIWGQYFATPGLYYGQSYPRREIERLAVLLEQARREAGMPALLEAEVEHGGAVYLFNADTAPVPVTISLTAKDHDILNPTVAWDGGRLAWKGRLRSGVRLEIIGAGRAQLVDPQGSRSSVGNALEGVVPALAPGEGDVFHFWHDGPEKGKLFQVELGYGRESKDVTRHHENTIAARRLEWFRDPFLVFHPTTSQYAEKRGFFPVAHVVHRHLGSPPVYEVSEVETLPVDMDDPVWSAAPSLELVRGREKGGTPYQAMGFPADLRTHAQLVYTRDALAVTLMAEGAPVEGETVTLKVLDKTFEVAVDGTDNDDGNPLVRQLLSDDNGWRALAVLTWDDVGLPEAERPVSHGAGPADMRHKLPFQLLRSRGDDSYLWSPPLGSPWGHDQQGPGTLVFLSL